MITINNTTNTTGLMARTVSNLVFGNVSTDSFISGDFLVNGNLISFNDNIVRCFAAAILVVEPLRLSAVSAKIM